MFGIFDPPYLGCPTCNADPKRHTGYAVSAHTRVTRETYRGCGCGHEFSLFEALKTGCHGTFGILGTFSHWQWSTETAVTVGRLSTISVPVPSGIRLFATFLTPYTPADGPQVRYIPKTLDTKGGELLISATAFGTTPIEMLGTEMRLSVGVYGCRESESRGWTRLLYESLGDYSEHRYTMAVFKLATSLEIACDRSLEVYLNGKSIPPSLTRRMLNSGRNWHTRLGRVREILPTLLTKNELDAFDEAAKVYLDTVRTHRNAFAHDDPDSLDHGTASKAFKTSFPILWAIERIVT